MGFDSISCRGLWFYFSSTKLTRKLFHYKVKFIPILTLIVSLQSNLCCQFTWINLGGKTGFSRSLRGNSLKIDRWQFKLWTLNMTVPKLITLSIERSCGKFVMELTHTRFRFNYGDTCTLVTSLQAFHEEPIQYWQPKCLSRICQFSFISERLIRIL